MICPACGTQMVEEDFGGVRIDFCRNGCKSVWFDCFELQRLDETHEGCGRILDEALAAPRMPDDWRDQLQCPSCNIPMTAHRHKRAQSVTVDECYKCGGFFLDAGELKAIRENFMSDRELHDYLDTLKEQVPEFPGTENAPHRAHRRGAFDRLAGLLGRARR